MEATGNYHLPIAHYLKDRGYTVQIINPLEMKRYRCQGIRNLKTDNLDAAMIAQFGIDFWFRPYRDSEIDEKRDELKLLGVQYLKFMKGRQERCLSLNNDLDRTNPGIYGKLDDFNRLKHYRVVMFAAYNTYLRIYHSRVSSVLNEVDLLA